MVIIFGLNKVSNFSYISMRIMFSLYSLFILLFDKDQVIKFISNGFIFHYSLDLFSMKINEKIQKLTPLQEQLKLEAPQCSICLNIATMTFCENFGYVWKIREKMDFFILKKSIISILVFRGQTLSQQHSNHSQRLFSI